MHKSDLEIANSASKKHIKDIAASLNIPEEALIVYGNMEMIKLRLIMIT